jgi:hypothetical protein
LLSTDLLQDPQMNQVLGWREWFSLPDLQIPGIKAKIDTGARTSALHAFFVEPYTEGGVQMVRFGVHPLQRREDIELICHAKVKEQRQVTDSGGHPEQRYVIETTVCLGPHQRRIEITLTNRDPMKFRMLLGRSALQKFSLLVDSGHSYLIGKSLQKKYLHLKDPAQ